MNVSTKERLIWSQVNYFYSNYTSMHKLKLDTPHTFTAKASAKLMRFYFQIFLSVDLNILEKEEPKNFDAIELHSIRKHLLDFIPDFPSFVGVNLLFAKHFVLLNLIHEPIHVLKGVKVFFATAEDHFVTNAWSSHAVFDDRVLVYRSLMLASDGNLQLDSKACLIR